MNKIYQRNATIPLLLSCLLTASIAACSTSKTATDAPSSTETNGQVPVAENAQPTQDDAQSDLRKKQLAADIRAREQRNNIAGNPEKRAEADLASEVRSKLEANIPEGKLTVEAKNADLTISGVVKTQAQLDKIKPLTMQIKGVKSVIVKAVIAP
jgi:hyperosmotically inducible periplasmic protein